MEPMKMIRNRIVWLIIIIAAVSMYIFANGTFTMALLVLCAAIPAASLVMLAAAQGADAKINIMQGSNSSSGGMQQVSLRLKNRGRAPMAAVSLPLTCRNIRSGQIRTVTVEESVPGAGSVDAGFDIDAGYAGVYEIAVAGGYSFDALRLAGRKNECRDSARFTVMPRIFDIPVSLAVGGSSMDGPERYSDRRSGNDPGEVRNIHEYVPGDPTRNIHWKLSEKTDKVLVKELGLPIMERVLVLLDTSVSKKLTPEGSNAIAEVYMSLLFSLEREGIDFSAGWPDEEERTAVIKKITGPDDITSAADRFLAVPPMEESVMSRLDPEETGRNFAHLIVVGAQLPWDRAVMPAGCSVTFLLYGHKDGFADIGTVRGFDDDAGRMLAAGIEI